MWFLQKINVHNKKLLELNNEKGEQLVMRRAQTKDFYINWCRDLDSYLISTWEGYVLPITMKLKRNLQTKLKSKDKNLAHINK